MGLNVSIVRETAIVEAIISRSEVARYLKHHFTQHEALARALCWYPRHEEEFYEFGSREDLYESMGVIDD